MINHNIASIIAEASRPNSVWAIEIYDTSGSYRDEGVTILCHDIQTIKIQGVKLLKERLKKYLNVLWHHMSVDYAVNSESFMCKLIREQLYQRSNIYFVCLPKLDTLGNSQEAIKILVEKFEEFVDKLDSDRSNKFVPFVELGAMDGFKPLDMNIYRKEIK